MHLKIKNISHTVTVNGVYGIVDDGNSNACATGHTTKPPTCTNPRSFADCLEAASPALHQRLTDVITDHLAAIQRELVENGLPIDDKAFDVVQQVIVNVRAAT
jgi:hypothetical protein